MRGDGCEGLNAYVSGNHNHRHHRPPAPRPVSQRTGHLPRHCASHPRRTWLGFSGYRVDGWSRPISTTCLRKQLSALPPKLPGADNSALNADAFTIYISTLSPKHLVDTLRRIGVSLNWDDIGRLPDVRRVLEKRDTRETAKAAEQCLRDFVQKRNRIAHCGSGGLVVTDGDIEQLIKFFRVFSRSLAGIVEARIADTLRGRD